MRRDRGNRDHRSQSVSERKDFRFDYLRRDVCITGLVHKRFVYILRSEPDCRRHYVGVTSDVTERLRWHNAGLNVHTARNRPWTVIVSLEFSTEQAARRFERYLKTGSGRAFAKRHFP